MANKESFTRDIEEALIGRWDRSDNQFFLFFHPNEKIGETGKVHCTTQELLLAITPPYLYQIVLIDAGMNEEGVLQYETWLHIIDDEAVTKYRIEYLNGGIGKMHLTGVDGKTESFDIYHRPQHLRMNF